MPSAPTRVGPDLWAVDSGYLRPGLDAIHILQSGDHTAIIDTGTHASVPVTLAALDTLGIPRDQVDCVLLTHIHLDHAGGAGGLMQELPAARLVVHPRGARHMADPSRLVAGSIAVYGEATFRQLYGQVLAIDAARIHATEDNERLQLGDRALRFLHTPGHAKHHHCIEDIDGEGVFTGDTFGIAFPELRVAGRSFIFPTTSPVHFDPAAAHASIDRIVATGQDVAWLTHYSRVEGLADLADQLHAHLDAFVRLTAESLSVDALESAVLGHLQQSLDALGHPAPRSERAPFLELDARLNAQGLWHWRTAHR